MSLPPWVLPLGLAAVAVWYFLRRDARGELGDPPREAAPPPRPAALPPEIDPSHPDYWEPEAETVTIPITEALDLHTFAPDETREVVEAYLEECRRRGLTQVRIIHGKGIGVQRRIVHACLAEHPAVERFADATGCGRGGATHVTLKW